MFLSLFSVRMNIQECMWCGVDDSIFRYQPHSRPHLLGSERKMRSVSRIPAKVGRQKEKYSTKKR
jgi:hypothetical protein